MNEPDLCDQAFMSRDIRGYHYVRYPDGNMSMLMNEKVATNYARIFGGTVHRHSQAPKGDRTNWKLLIGTTVLAIGFILAWGAANGAFGSEFRPLTRDEPIVRMVLQESANEPIEGQVAVAGVALDRMYDERWPNTAKAVVYQPWQFTGMRIKLRRYSRQQVMRARLAVQIARTGYRPCGYVFWYHTEDVNPKWAKRFRKHCQIGAHIFYGD